MKRLIALVIVLIVSVNAFSQKEIITAATEFIKQEQYRKANLYLDSVLKLHPKNVDALMMKGNVLLNYTWTHTSKRYFNIERAESVFDTASIGSDFYVPVIPEDTSKLIERYWKRCLTIDSTRTDIKKGLCNLYSVSLRIEPLQKQLLQMKKLVTERSENAFVYAEYARNIKARGAFEEGMKMYQFIADMFPGLAGIRCDMAGEYFYNGKPNEALRYLDSTLSEKEIDQTSYINAATIYSMLGYYDNAYHTFQRYSQQENLLVADFYSGLMMFAKMDSGFYRQLQDFLSRADEKSYYDEIQLAQKLLPFAKTAFGFGDYVELAQNEKIPNYYKVLIHQRAMMQYKDICTPFLRYGYFQCTLKNYNIAAQFLSEIDNCKEETEQTEFWLLACGYAFYMSGQKEASWNYFDKLVNSRNAFRQQAAKYFTAAILLEQKQMSGATVLEELMTAKEETKYGWLVKNK